MYNSNGLFSFRYCSLCGTWCLQVCLECHKSQWTFNGQSSHRSAGKYAEGSWWWRKAIFQRLKLIPVLLKSSLNNLARLGCTALRFNLSLATCMMSCMITQLHRVVRNRKRDVGDERKLQILPPNPWDNLTGQDQGGREHVCEVC